MIALLKVYPKGSYHFEMILSNLNMKQTLILLSFLILISGVVFALTPEPPDYSNLFFRAAPPHKTDASDQVPLFLSDEKRELLADVFFPTQLFMTMIQVLHLGMPG